MKTKIKIGNLGINWIGTNFKEWFGEPSVTPKKVDFLISVLEQPMNDKEIFEKYKPNECTLDDVAFALTNNIIQKDWFGGIFYIKDSAGVLRTVDVFWYGDGWDVGAGPVGYPFRWPDGLRVFSRNSVLESSEPEPKTLSPSESLTLESAIKMVKDNGLKVIREL